MIKGYVEVYLQLRIEVRRASGTPLSASDSATLHFIAAEKYKKKIKSVSSSRTHTMPLFPSPMLAGPGEL